MKNLMLLFFIVNFSLLYACKPSPVDPVKESTNSGNEKINEIEKDLAEPNSVAISMPVEKEEIKELVSVEAKTTKSANATVTSPTEEPKPILKSNVVSPPTKENNADSNSSSTKSQEVKVTDSEVKEERLPKPKEIVNEIKFEKNDPENPINKVEEVIQSEITATGADHATFNGLLSTYVTSSGVVNYKGFKSDEAKLDAYLESLADNVPTSSTRRNAALAYWINAYNAFTIKLILKNYPVSSITDLEGGKPWDVKWIKLGDNTYSLNNIENDIIRPTYKEPRIHFAVNCAAKSCPPLANKAFTASNLESLLESQTVAFINNTTYNKLSREAVTVSKIFDWYGVDFGDIATYVSKYALESVKKEAKVSYKEYDWSLNGK